MPPQNTPQGLSVIKSTKDDNNIINQRTSEMVTSFIPGDIPQQRRISDVTQGISSDVISTKVSDEHIYTRCLSVGIDKEALADKPLSLIIKEIKSNADLDKSDTLPQKIQLRLHSVKIDGKPFTEVKEDILNLDPDTISELVLLPSGKHVGPGETIITIDSQVIANKTIIDLIPNIRSMITTDKYTLPSGQEVEPGEISINLPMGLDDENDHTMQHTTEMFKTGRKRLTRTGSEAMTLPGKMWCCYHQSWLV